MHPFFMAVLVVVILSLTTLVVLLSVYVTKLMEDLRASELCRTYDIKMLTTFYRFIKFASDHHVTIVTIADPSASSGFRWKAFHPRTDAPDVVAFAPTFLEALDALVDFAEEEGLCDPCS